MRPTAIVFLICALAAGQAPNSGAASRPANDENAAQLFNRALAAQTNGGPPIAIRDFQAELQVTVHETDPKTKERKRNSARVVEYYRDRGQDTPLYRRHLFDAVQKNETVQGYDGERYWQKLGNTPARDLTRGRESKEDRDRIKNERDRTKDFVRLLILSSYDGPGVTFRDLGRAKLAVGDTERDVEKIVRERPGDSPIELMIGDDDHKRPVLYGFQRQTPAGKAELIVFSFHTPIRTQGGTVLVPLVAKYYEQGVITFEAAASKDADVKLNTNPPLEDRLFAMPR